MSYELVGDPIEKTVGEKDVVEFDYAHWLGGESLESATVAVEPGVSSVLIADWQISPDETKVLVAYEVLNRVARLAHIVVTAHSDNPNRVAANRAVAIKIF
jgi:hypothetical protein